MLRAPLRASFLGLGLVLGAFALVDFAGCGSSESPRKGAAGESCTRADDCEASLSCIDKVCTDPNAKPDGGGGSGGSGGGGGAGLGGQGPSADAGPWSACDECLDKACADELAACDSECVAIEACIETVCAHLSAIDAPKEEGACQVKCQEEHGASTQKHLDVVNCAVSAKCAPPCVPYPDDHDACRAFMDKGDCKAARAACKNSSDCQTYQDCVGTCATVKDCIACDDTASGQAGRALFESYQQCIAAECILTSWLSPP